MNDELIYDIEAAIGINYENVLVSCCYEEDDRPTILKVMYKDVDIQGALSAEQIDELEVYADQVLKVLFGQEKDEGRISEWEANQLGKAY
jgi:hypothetical protein